MIFNTVVRGKLELSYYQKYSFPIEASIKIALSCGDSCNACNRDKGRCITVIFSS